MKALNRGGWRKRLSNQQLDEVGEVAIGMILVSHPAEEPQRKLNPEGSCERYVHA